MPKTKIAKQNTVIEIETLMFVRKHLSVKIRIILKPASWAPWAYGRRMHFLLGKNRENWSDTQLEQVNGL